MKRIIILILLFAVLKVTGQTTGYLRYDTVRIMKQNGTCELYIINKTKDTLGLLTNIGGGLTTFKRPRKLNDSAIIIGKDTLDIRASVKWFNVADAGADRTGAMDISTFLTAAMAAGRRDIYLPKGRYLINNTVQMKDSVTIRGDGRQNTIIVLSSGIPAFKLGHANGGYRCQFMDIGFEGTVTLTGDGSYSSGGDGLQTGILIDSVSGVFVHNVGGYKLAGWVVRIRKNGYCCGLYPANAARSNVISNSYAQGCYGGFALDTLAEYNTVDNCTAANGVYGVFVAGGNNRVNNNSLSANQNNLVISGGANDGHGVATGNILNHASGTNLFITGVTLGFAFSNNMIYAGSDQLAIINSDNISFQGGDIVGSGNATITNSTNVHFTDVNMRVAPTWVITGTAPTVWRNGKTINSTTQIDVVNNKEFVTTHTNGTVDFTLPAGSKYRFSDTFAVKTTAPEDIFHVTGNGRFYGRLITSPDNNFRAAITGSAPAQFTVKQTTATHGINLQLGSGAFSSPNFVFWKNGSSTMNTLTPTGTGHQLGTEQWNGVDSSGTQRGAVNIRADVERCASTFLSGGLAIFTNDSSGTSRLSYFDGHGNLGLGTATGFNVGPGNPFRLHVSDGLVRFGYLRGSGFTLTGVDNDGIFRNMKFGSGLTLNATSDTVKLTNDVVRNIKSDSFTNVANVNLDLTSFQTGGYARIEIQIECRPVTDNVTLQMRLSNDGGSTYNSGATDYGWVNKWSIFLGPADGINADDQDSELELVQNLGNASANICNGALRFYHPFDANFIPIYDGTFNTNSNTTSPAGAMILSQVGGQMFTARFTNAIRFLLSSGNFDKFKYTVIGYKN